MPVNVSPIPSKVPSRTMDSWLAGDPFPSRLVPYVDAEGELVVSQSGTVLALQESAGSPSTAAFSESPVREDAPAAHAHAPADDEGLPDESSSAFLPVSSPPRPRPGTKTDLPFKFFALGDVGVRASGLTSDAESSMQKRRHSVRKAKAAARQAVNTLGDLFRKGADTVLAAVGSPGLPAPPPDAPSHPSSEPALTASPPTIRHDRTSSVDDAEYGTPRTASPTADLPTPLDFLEDGPVTQAVYYFEVSVRHLETAPGSGDGGVAIGFVDGTLPPVCPVFMFTLFT